MSANFPQRLAERHEKVNQWFKANPHQFELRKGPNFCFVSVKVPSKENPAVFEVAYEVQRWVAQPQ